MIHKKQGVLVVALAVAGVSLLSACSPSSDAPAGDGTVGDSVVAEARALLPQEVLDRGSIVLATDAQYPPCESVDESGDIVGFEPDLWNEVAARLGIEIEVENVKFESLIPGVQSGRYDVAMECISDTQERQEILDFVDIAVISGSTVTLATNESDISEDALSLCGLRGGAQVGTNFLTNLNGPLNDNCVAAGKPKVEVFEFPTNDAVMLSLYSGRTDFVLQNSLSSSLLVENAPEPVVFFDNEFMAATFTGPVFKKGNDQLRDAFLAAFQSMYDDGTYESIMNEWNFPTSSLTEPGINLGKE